ncbi:BREX protein BrxB domain-containing protein [Paraburkholderia heleia]|uniref:BREX protein BrxB domain-containing protein n=1 Tax=Paraburkholderia heleia TaxID=634127 RepID=UPI002AB5E607|nr:BREX protein BrxB domain-containing protein [Paraburkholderia heleia]
MARLEDLAELYGNHISTPWQRTVAGAQRVIMVTYDKELERVLRARKDEFETRTRAAGHDWFEVDVTTAFSSWLAADDYREAYFESPEDLQMKLDAEFSDYVASLIRSVLTRTEVTENSVVAVLGVGSLFGFARVSQVLKLVEGDVTGRLVVFFPGQFEQNNYRLLDARDGWNYMAVPISIHSAGGAS